jgi:hypothetical protein
VIKPHKHFVAFVGRAAYRVADDNDEIADINRVEHGRQHANVGLGPRDNQSVRLAAS